MSVLQELVTKLSYAYENSRLKAYIRDINQASSKVKKPLEDIDQSFGETKQNLFSLRNMLMSYFGMIAGGSAIKIADDWASVSGRIKLATASAEEHKYALEQIYAISQRTNQEYTATGDLFQKVQRNAKDLGLGIDDTLNLTEIIGQTMSIGGGDAGAQQAALMQLGQALGSGTLRGDELNSIIEQAPRLAQAIADAFGVGVGQLKELGSKGKLTAKDLSQGLLKQAEKIQAEFDQMPKTFAAGMTKMRNSAGKFLSYAINDVLRLGSAFYKLSGWLEDNIKLVLILAMSAIGSKLILALKAVNGQLSMILAKSLKAALPFLKIAAVLTAIGLIVEDIYGWTQGYISVTGGLIGRFDEWEHLFNQLADNAKLLWASIKGLVKDLTKLFNLDIDFGDSFYDFFGVIVSSGLKYAISGLNNLIKLLRVITASVRALFRGEFTTSFKTLATGIDNLSWKFLPFYFIAASVITKIGGVILWLAKTPFMLLRVAILTISRLISLAFATNPIGLLILAISLAVGLIISYWDEIVEAASNAWDWIKEKASNALDFIIGYIKSEFERLESIVTNIWDAIINLFKGNWQAAIDSISKAFTSLIPDWVKNLFGGGAKVTINSEMEKTTELVDTATDFAVQAGNLTGIVPSSHLPNNVKNATNNITNNNVINVNGGASPMATAQAVNNTLSKSSYQLASVEG